MHLGNFFTSITIVIVSIFMISPACCADKISRRRARTCPKVEIPNADLSYRSRARVMRVNCLPGYVLYGSNYVICDMGKWNAALPVCARGGCKELESPPNGDINYSQKQQAHLYCRAGYKLAGGRVTYCNGTAWDRPLGTCRESTTKIQLACDFETEDLCGWSHDETHDFDWKRIMAGNVFSKLRTGPQHDHTSLTANSGHFMLMESFDQAFASVARLISPIYSKNLTVNSACFRFYYFMYGATVGNLSVYVRPLSVSSDNLMEHKNNQIKPTYRYFFKSGNQMNVWKEAQFTIEEMSEDFQIIIEGTTGTSHLSDIAIDDVHLMTYPECYGEQLYSTTAVSEVTEYAIYDVQSCEGRCGETNIMHYGLTKKYDLIYKNCDCHSDCEDLKTCCPNYQTVCELSASDSSTEISDAGTISSNEKKTSATLASTVAVKKLTTELTAASTSTSTSTKTTTTTPTTTTTTLKPHITNITTTVASEKATTFSTSRTSTTKQRITIQVSTPSTTTTITTRKTSTAEATVNLATMISVINSVATKKSPDPATATPPSIEEKTRILPKVLSVDDKPTQRERIISWDVAHKAQPTSKSPSWLIFISATIGFTVIVAIGVVLRFHRTCRRIQIYKRGSTNDDTTTLLYCQNDEVIVVS